MRKALTFIVSAVLMFTSIGLFSGCSDNKNTEQTNHESEMITDFPVFSVLTENNVSIVSKEEYVKCTVSLSNTDYEYEFSDLDAKIKGRGNSTWAMPKKPYKLKFDKKVDLFGNGAAKTWTILANYYDKSQIRNYLAFGVADLFDTQKLCTSTHFINLYVNNQFYGVYLICEQIEVADTRVEIDEDLSDVNTGYLIELDARAPDEGVLGTDYFNLNDKDYAIKSPDTEDELFTEEHVNYIKNYMADAMNLFGEEKNWELLTELIDVKSFAENYIIHELFHNADAGISSFYMYKEKDGKLFAGPIWDFDLSAGYHPDLYGNKENFFNPEKHYACTVNPWFEGLVKYDEFKLLLAEILNEKTEEIIELIDDKTDFVLSMENSFANEFVLWQESSIGWKTEVKNLKDWLIQSANFLKSEYVK